MTSSRYLVARLVGCAPWDRHALPHGLLVQQGQPTSPVIKSLLSVTSTFVQCLACPLLLQPWGAGHSALVSQGTACWFQCLVPTVHHPSLCVFALPGHSCGRPDCSGHQIPQSLALQLQRYIPLLSSLMALCSHLPGISCGEPLLHNHWISKSPAVWFQYEVPVVCPSRLNAVSSLASAVVGPRSSSTASHWAQ